MVAWWTLEPRGGNLTPKALPSVSEYGRVVPAGESEEPMKNVSNVENDSQQEPPCDSRTVLGTKHNPDVERNRKNERERKSPLTAPCDRALFSGGTSNTASSSQGPAF
jgi:hypothetical protein